MRHTRPSAETTRRADERRRGRVGADAQGETREGAGDVAKISRRMYEEIRSSRDPSADRRGTMWKTAIALVPRREDDPPATRRPHPQRTLCGQRSQGRRSVHRPAARAAITSMRGGCRRLMWRLEAYAARNSDPAALAGGGAYIFIRPFSPQRLSVLLCCAPAWGCVSSS